MAQLQSASITGSLTVTGQVVAQTLNVQQVTSSIVYSSGSNIFGNTLGNTQQFTGSLQVSGSSHNILGNVGIGPTGTPAAELQVGKSSDVAIAMSNSSSVTSGNRGSLAWYNSSNSTVANIKATAVTDNVGTQLEFYTRPVAGSLTQVLTIASTGAATFSSTLQVGGNASSTITIGDASAGAFDANIRLRTGSTKTSWLIASQNNIAGFEITPSTTVGGTTYSTPAFSILASTGAATFSSSVTAAGYVFIGLDGTYGPTYSGISFQGTSAGVNGENRIFAGRAGADGLYLASATSRAIYFRAGGSTSDHLTISSTGAATFSSTVTATKLTSGGDLEVGTSSGNDYILKPGVSATGTGSLIIQAGFGSAGAGGGIVLYSHANATYPGGVWIGRSYGSSGPIIFGSGGTGPQTEQMRITSGGNVGIGNSPSYKLDITNSVAASTSLDPITLRLYNGSDGGSAIYFSNSVSGQSKISFGVESTGAGTDDSYLGFSTGTNTALTERMRITSDGQVLVGMTSNGGSAVTSLRAGLLSGQRTASADECLSGWNQATSGDNRFVAFYTEANGTLRGTIDYNRGAGLVRYNTTSDSNLKNIIGNSDKTKSIDILNSTKIREYSWKDDEFNKVQIGVIAQELYETYKGAVSEGSSDELLGTEDYKPWGVDKTAFTFHLVAGFQEHERIIKELQTQIETLKSKIEILEQS